MFLQPIFSSNVKLKNVKFISRPAAEPGESALDVAAVTIDQDGGQKTLLLRDVVIDGRTVKVPNQELEEAVRDMKFGKILKWRKVEAGKLVKSKALRGYGAGLLDLMMTKLTADKIKMTSLNKLEFKKVAKNLVTDYYPGLKDIDLNVVRKTLDADPTQALSDAYSHLTGFTGTAADAIYFGLKMFAAACAPEKGNFAQDGNVLMRLLEEIGDQSDSIRYTSDLCRKEIRETLNSAENLEEMSDQEAVMNLLTGTLFNFVAEALEGAPPSYRKVEGQKKKDASKRDEEEDSEKEEENEMNEEEDEDEEEEEEEEEKEKEEKEEKEEEEKEDEEEEKEEEEEERSDEEEKRKKKNKSKINKSKAKKFIIREAEEATNLSTSEEEEKEETRNPKMKKKKSVKRNLSEDEEDEGLKKLRLDAKEKSKTTEEMKKQLKKSVEQLLTGMRRWDGETTSSNQLISALVTSEEKMDTTGVSEAVPGLFAPMPELETSHGCGSDFFKLPFGGKTYSPDHGLIKGIKILTLLVHILFQTFLWAGRRLKFLCMLRISRQFPPPMSSERSLSVSSTSFKASF